MNSTSERWILDYRSIGESRWPEDLRAEVTDELRRSTRKLVRWLLTTPACFLIAFVSGVGGNAVGFDPFTSWIAAVFVMLGLIAIPVAILLGNDRHKERLAFRRALQGETVELFVLGQHVEEERRAVESLGGKHDLEGMPVRLTIEPRTSMLLRVDEKATLKPIELVDVRTTTQTGRKTETRLQQCDRALNADESDELRKSVASTRKAIRRFRAIYAIVTLLIVLSVSLNILSLPGTSPDWSFSIVLGLVWIAQSWRLVTFIRPLSQRVRMLTKDLNIGTTELLDGHAAMDERRQMGAHASEIPQVNPEWVRILPHSRMWWEVDGVPALWRRI